MLQLSDYLRVVSPNRDGAFTCASIDSVQGILETSDLDERPFPLCIRLDHRLASTIIPETTLFVNIHVDTQADRNTEDSAKVSEMVP